MLLIEQSDEWLVSRRYLSQESLSAVLDGAEDTDNEDQGGHPPSAPPEEPNVSPTILSYTTNRYLTFKDLAHPERSAIRPRLDCLSLSQRRNEPLAPPQPHSRHAHVAINPLCRFAHSPRAHANSPTVRQPATLRRIGTHRFRAHAFPDFWCSAANGTRLLAKRRSAGSRATGSRVPQSSAARPTDRRPSVRPV